MRDEFAIAQVAQAQRDAFLSAYETRATMDSAFTLARRLAIPRQVVMRWMRDPTFVGELREADSWRTEIARETFARRFPAIAENMCDLACGRTRASVRAAAWVARCMGIWRAEPLALTQVTVHTATVINAPTQEALDRMLRERDRVNRVIARYVDVDGNGHAEPTTADIP